MKTYQPIKKIYSQTNTHFASMEEMNKFFKENPQYENGGMTFGYTGSGGVGVMLNEYKDILIFGNEFDRFEFMQTNKEFEIDELVIYNGKPAVWLKAKN